MDFAPKSRENNTWLFFFFLKDRNNWACGYSNVKERRCGVRHYKIREAGLGK